jgi:hypothetical protein
LASVILLCKRVCQSVVSVHVYVAWHARGAFNKLERPVVVNIDMFTVGHNMSWYVFIGIITYQVIASMRMRLRNGKLVIEKTIHEESSPVSPGLYLH